MDIWKQPCGFISALGLRGLNAYWATRFSMKPPAGIDGACGSTCLVGGQGEGGAPREEQPGSFIMFLKNI